MMISMNLSMPELWVSRLKHLARERSYIERRDVRYGDLIREVVAKAYGFGDVSPTPPPPLPALGLPSGARRSKVNVAEALELRRQGYSYRQIGARFGVTWAGVRYHVVRAQRAAAVVDNRVIAPIA